MFRKIACLGLVVTTLLPLTAQAAQRDLLLSTRALSPARADGADAIALIDIAGTVRVLDGRGTPRAAVDVSGGCLQPPSQLVAVGGGQTLYMCSVEHDTSFGAALRDEPRLLDLATRSVHVPAGAGVALDGVPANTCGDWFDDVGVYGVELHVACAHDGGWVEAINWHSGAKSSSRRRRR